MPTQHDDDRSQRARRGRARAVPAEARGRLATMPAKMISDMPLPMPRDGDLFAEPHQEHGAAGQRDDGREQEERAGMDDDVVAALEADGDAIGLQRREEHGA